MLFYCYLPSRLVAGFQCACPTISAYNPVRRSVAGTEGGGGKREKHAQSHPRGPSSLTFTPCLRSFRHLLSPTFLPFLSLPVHIRGTGITPRVQCPCSLHTDRLFPPRFMSMNISFSMNQLSWRNFSFFLFSRFKFFFHVLCILRWNFLWLADTAGHRY